MGTASSRFCKHSPLLKMYWVKRWLWRWETNDNDQSMLHYRSASPLHQITEEKWATVTNQLWSASHQLLKLLPERFEGIEISDEGKPNCLPLKRKKSALKLEGTSNPLLLCVDHQQETCTCQLWRRFCDVFMMDTLQCAKISKFIFYKNQACLAFRGCCHSLLTTSTLLSMPERLHILLITF